MKTTVYCCVGVIGVLLFAGAAAGPDPAAEGIAKGNAACDRGEFDKAVEAYTEAIEASPNSALAYYCRGYAHAKLNAHAEGDRGFQRRDRLAPSVADAYDARGTEYFTNVRWGSDRRTRTTWPPPSPTLTRLCA